MTHFGWCIILFFETLKVSQILGGEGRVKKDFLCLTKQK